MSFLMTTFENNSEEVSLLLNYGANPSKFNKEEHSPFTKSLLYPSIEIIEQMLMIGIAIYKAYPLIKFEYVK